nr:hypothetical protein [Tanacetum cinerariifolium]
MESVKKSIDERALHKREYDTRVNERQMQTNEGKVDTSNALDASLVDTKSSGTGSGKKDTSSSSGNDVDADDADIKPVYDEEPMAEIINSYNSISMTEGGDTNDIRSTYEEIDEEDEVFRSDYTEIDSNY